MRSCLPLRGALLGLEHRLLSDVPVQKHMPSKRNLSHPPSMPHPGGDSQLVPDGMLPAFFLPHPYALPLAVC